MDLPKMIFEEKFDEVKKIITQNDINLNAVNVKKNTLLLAAIDTDNINFIKFLLEQGADSNYLTKGIDLPLNYAIETSVEAEDYMDDVDEVKTDIIELLLEYGADMMKEDNFNRSPYEFAKNYHIPAQKLFEKMKNNL